MHTTLTIIAKIEAHPDQIERVKTELVNLIEPTRKEAGCIQYDLHQDNNNPAVFLFYENWETRDLWLTHMESAHLKAYVAATEGAVASFVLNEMSRI